jgi:hypothetical protein
MKPEDAKCLEKMTCLVRSKSPFGPPLLLYPDFLISEHHAKLRPLAGSYAMFSYKNNWNFTFG